VWWDDKVWIDTDPGFEWPPKLFSSRKLKLKYKIIKSIDDTMTMIDVNNPMLEACVAALSFLFWILFFKYLHTTSIGQKYRFSNSKNVHFFGTSKDVGIYATLPTYLFVIYVYHTYVRETKSLESYRSPEDHLLSKLFSTEESFLFNLTGLIRLFLEVTLGILLYDVCFWCVHITLHRVQYLFTNVHQRHHLHKQLTPGSTVSHSFLDGTLQVLVNILAQQYSLWGYKHTYSRLLHNIIVTYMLVEIHAELDAPWSLHNLFGGRLFGGALRHRYHHAYTLPGYQGKKAVHYHQFFKILDDLCGYSVSDKACRDVKFQ
jgi:hypothetical protein